MEQHQERDAEPSSKYSKMNKQQFEDLITVNRNDRYEPIFFILNTLNFIVSGNTCYCHCEKMKIKKMAFFRSLVGDLVIARSVRYCACLMILNEISTKTDLISRYWTDTMTSSSRSWWNFSKNVLKLLNAFMGVNMFIVVVTGTVKNSGEWHSLKAFDILME